MGITRDRLLEVYPTVFHMAYPGNWDSICKHGLRCTRDLLDLFEVNGEEKSRLLRQRRDEAAILTHPTNGQMTLRDQKPLSDSTLKKCLQDRLSPADWYERLNSMTFFWVDRRKLEGLLGGRAYRDSEHIIIEVPTDEILDCFWDDVRLSPINSGNTRPNPQPRGNGTFLHPDLYPFDELRKRRRSTRDAVRELAVVAQTIPVLDIASRVAIQQHGRSERVLVSR